MENDTKSHVTFEGFQVTNTGLQKIKQTMKKKRKKRKEKRGITYRSWNKGSRGSKYISCQKLLGKEVQERQARHKE